MPEIYLHIWNKITNKQTKQSKKQKQKTKSLQASLSGLLWIRTHLLTKPCIPEPQNLAVFLEMVRATWTTGLYALVGVSDFFIFHKCKAILTPGPRQHWVSVAVIFGMVMMQSSVARLWALQLCRPRCSQATLPLVTATPQESLGLPLLGTLLSLFFLGIRCVLGMFCCYLVWRKNFSSCIFLKTQLKIYFLKWIEL